MKYSELIPLVASVVNFALAFFVFSRSWRSTMNRVYLLWGISLTVWNFGTYFMFRVPLIETPENHAEAIFWAKFLQFGVIFLPVTLFHIGFLIAKVPTGKKMPLLYFMHCVFALSNFGGFFVHDDHVRALSAIAISAPDSTHPGQVPDLRMRHPGIFWLQ